MPGDISGTMLEVLHDLLSAAQAGQQTVTLLASAVRTALTDSPAQTKPAGAGRVLIFLNITAVPGTDTITAVLQGQDPVSLVWYDLIAGTAQVSAALSVIAGGPGVAAGGGLSKLYPGPLPAVWRVEIRPSAASNFTYSVGATYAP